MKKFTTIAATLAMVLVAAVPAYAQDATVGDNDGNNRNGEDNSTVQTADSSQYTLAVFGDQTANQDANVSNNGGNVAVGGINQEQTQESNQMIQNAQSDDGSIAFNVNDFDNDGINDDEENRSVSFEDADFDGIADVFDYFVLFGDFDNDGVNDGASASASASASGDATASAFAFSD